MEFILKALLIVIIGGLFGILEGQLFGDEPTNILHKILLLVNGGLLTLVLQQKVGS